MPHYICRWTSGDVLVASVSCREELEAILRQRSELGSCKVARYNAPLAFELTPKLPGIARSSSKRFKVPEPIGALPGAWPERALFSDVRALAADGSSEPAHKVVLRARCPVLTNLTDAIQNVRFQVIPTREVLLAFLEYVYTDDVQQHRVSHHLHMAAIQCRMPRLVALCEARLAQRIEQELAAWGSYSPQQQASCADFVLDWVRYCERLQRAELKDFCCHVISRHYAVAAERPNWRKLQSATVRLIEAVAAVEQPPVVQRQVASDCGAASVTLESDLYARSGGRLNESEWAQLQRYRSGCHAATEQLPASCPLVMTDQEMYDCGLTMDEPSLSYELQASDLDAQKSVLSAITRFAFPVVHRSLGALRQSRQDSCMHELFRQQLQHQEQQQEVSTGSAAPAAAAGGLAGEEWQAAAESEHSNQLSSSQLGGSQEVEQQPRRSSRHHGAQQQQQHSMQRQRHRLHRQTGPEEAANLRVNAVASSQPPTPVSGAAAQAQQPQLLQQQASGPAQLCLEAACIQRLQVSLVKDVLQYDESAGLKESLARLLVAAEAGCVEAAAKLVSGDVPSCREPTSDESCSETLSSSGGDEGECHDGLLHGALVAEDPFRAGAALPPGPHHAWQPALYAPALDEVHMEEDDLHPSADCDLLLRCGPPDMTSHRSGCSGPQAGLVGHKRSRQDGCE